MKKTDAREGMTRRTWLAAGSALPLAGTALGAAAHGREGSRPDLPARDAFPGIRPGYLNSGSVHPVSAGARQRVEDYLAARAMTDESDYNIAAARRTVTERFAQLINAETSELAYIQSTSAGEQMAVAALGLPEPGARVVTDALHFFGSFHLYSELEKAGVEVVVVRPRDNRIHLEDMEAAIDARTRLVSVSAIATTTGFQHDLAALTAIAHSRGAKVYVDAIHAIGSVPFDVKASGIDMMSTASYKWLMGDMGLGFMYARADLIPGLARPQAGYYQLAGLSSHVFPYDEPHESAYQTRARSDATGLFAMGTFSNTGVAHLDYSLDYLLDLGVERVQAARQPLIERVRAELTERGFHPLTPDDSTGPLIAFAYENARARLGPGLREAGVEISLSQHRFRVSPSVFNTMDDIEMLLEALA